MKKKDREKAYADFNNMLLNGATKPLEQMGLNAVAFMYEHPTFTPVQLVKQLPVGDWVSAFGLEMAIYHEAVQTQQVRKVAKELLFRYIVAEYPKGWKSTGKVCPAVRLVSWITACKSNVDQQTQIESVDQIYDDLVRDTPPTNGWKPQSVDDPYLTELFDRHWPLEKDGSQVPESIKKI